MPAKYRFFTVTDGGQFGPLVIKAASERDAIGSYFRNFRLGSRLEWDACKIVRVTDDEPEEYWVRAGRDGDVVRRNRSEPSPEEVQRRLEATASRITPFAPVRRSSGRRRKAKNADDVDWHGLSEPTPLPKRNNKQQPTQAEKLF